MEVELSARAKIAEIRREVESVRLRPGDRVLVVDAPSWCRRYFAGRTGRVARTFPFGDVWVRFERPVEPWCDSMDPVDEFPFAPAQLAAA